MISFVDTFPIWRIHSHIEIYLVVLQLKYFLEFQFNFQITFSLNIRLNLVDLSNVTNLGFYDGINTQKMHRWYLTFKTSVYIQLNHNII